VNSDEHRSIGQAMQWASRSSSIALQFALPAGGGAWLDQQYGSSPCLLILGAIVGSTLGYFEIKRLIRQLDS